MVPLLLFENYKRRPRRHGNVSADESTLAHAPNDTIKPASGHSLYDYYRAVEHPPAVEDTPGPSLCVVDGGTLDLPLYIYVIPPHFVRRNAGLIQCCRCYTKRHLRKLLARCPKALAARQHIKLYSLQNRKIIQKFLDDWNLGLSFDWPL